MWRNCFWSQSIKILSKIKKNYRKKLTIYHKNKIFIQHLENEKIIYKVKN